MSTSKNIIKIIEECICMHYSILPEDTLPEPKMYQSILLVILIHKLKHLSLSYVSLIGEK